MRDREMREEGKWMDTGNTESESQGIFTYHLSLYVYSTHTCTCTMYMHTLYIHIHSLWHVRCKLSCDISVCRVAEDEACQRSNSSCFSS